MADRTPLVLIDGRPSVLPSGDTLKPESLRGLQRVAATVSGFHTLYGAAGHVHDLTLTGDVTLTIPSATDPASVAISIIINQTGINAYNTVTWPNINWSLVGGSPPALNLRHTLVRLYAIAGSWFAYDAKRVGGPALSFIGHGWSSTITEPGGTQEGDLFVAIAHGPDVSASDALAGWSTINDQPTISGGHTSKLYYRLRGATSLTGTTIPNANATDSSPFFAVYRGYNTVNLANTDGEIVAASALVTRTINANGAILVWASDLFATTHPTVTVPNAAFLSSNKEATYFKAQAKSGIIAAGESVSVQDNHSSYGTNMWRVVVTAT